MQKMSPRMNVRGTENLSAYLYNVRAASSRFSFAHYYALHAIPWGLPHAVAISFPGDFLIELAQDISQHSRIGSSSQLALKEESSAESGENSVFGCGRCELDGGARQHRYSWKLSEGLDAAHGRF